MNTRRTLTRLGRAWCAQSVYLRARRARLKIGVARREPDDVIADLKAQWRAGMEAHVMEARRSSARRVEDIATHLNARDVQTRKGRRWDHQGVYRLLRLVGAEAWDRQRRWSSR